MNSTILEVHAKNRPMPEMFTRSDIRNSGGWDVANARAARGEPYITVSGRVMRVPLDDSELARAIRAHEQVHCKVSPQSIEPYITSVTGEGAIRAAEEARVNFIASMLGFPMKALVTGSEKFDGEQIAKNELWAEAVYAVAASVHTGSLKPLISGVRKENPDWADTLRMIGAEIEKFQKNQIKNIKKSLGGARKVSDADALSARYGSTKENRMSSTIVGMNFTIELAMLLESLATLPEPDEDEQQDENSTADDGGEAGIGSNGESKEEELKDNKIDLDREAIQEKANQIIQSHLGSNGLEKWGQLAIQRMPMSITLQGAIGRKRVPSQTGRNPRRMHRMLTDPERRVFDRYVKANGGVVLIDCSGSMQLSKEEVREMMLAAPGCTVIGYSYSYYGTMKANTFILGEKGKICNDLPRFWNGNGNDLPAIQYAVSLRNNRKTPVIWVTDGCVYRPGCASYVYDERECAIFARKNGVHMEYDPAGAIKFLQNLKAGAAYKPTLIDRWKDIGR